MARSSKKPAGSSPVGALTLWGEITSEDATHLTIAVANVGGALDVGLCGEVTFAKRQLFSRGRQDGYDYLRVSFALASLKAQSCQPCE